MATLNPATWVARYESRKAFPEGKDEDGNPKRIMVTVRAIYLTKVGAEPSPWTELKFGVAINRKSGAISITDHREELTGAVGVVQCGNATVDGTNKGVLKGAKYARAGRARSMTPTAWVQDVKRFIGEARANAIIDEIVSYGGQRRHEVRDLNREGI